MGSPNAKITGKQVLPKVRQWAAHVVTAGHGLVMPFSVNGYAVIPGELVEVARALREEDKNKPRIWLGYLPDGTDFRAGYVSGGYMLIERTVAKGELIRHQSRIIHESIHAAFDMRGRNAPFEMSTYADEACAYIAEAMYLRKSGVLADAVTDHKPLMVAWQMADSLHASHSVSKLLFVAFEQALADYGYLNTKRSKAGIG